MRHEKPAYCRGVLRHLTTRHIRAIPGLQNINTPLLPAEHPTTPEPAPVRKRGRPSKPDALSGAERARRYRANKKARLAAMQEAAKLANAVVPMTSAWARRWKTTMERLRKARTPLRAWWASARRLTT